MKKRPGPKPFKDKTSFRFILSIDQLARLHEKAAALNITAAAYLRLLIDVDVDIAAIAAAPDDAQRPNEQGRDAGQQQKTD